MSILRDIFSEQFIHALGWTLLHSLWQGALIALIIALLLVFLHRFSARFRYMLYSGSLLLFAGLAGFTFILSYASYPTKAGAEGPLNTASIALLPVQAAELTAGADGFSAAGIFDRLAAYCHEHLPLFVGIWLLGVLLMMLRFLGGYALVRRYRHQRVRPVAGKWDLRFSSLATRIRVPRSVRLMESALVKMPMAIGWLKPVVLIPLGMLNGVPAAQMEAILAHELAHIKRRDYLMNLFQSLLEVIFFYHPAVWWLSANIRSERENICDDIAINLTGNSMEFIKALTRIQEINLGSPALAAGLSGKNKNRLINRIRRLTGKQKIRTGFTEGFIAVLVLMISMAGLSAAAMFSGPPDMHSTGDPAILQELGGGLPASSIFFEPVPEPDTTEKAGMKEPKREVVVLAEKKELSAEEKEQLEQTRAAIEKEMQAMQLQMQEAMNEYRMAMEEYRKEMQESMEWREVENLEASDLYFFNGQPYQLFADSLQWNYAFPDSLSDLISDRFEHYAEAEFLLQEDLEELGYKMDELADIQELAALEQLSELAELERLSELGELAELSAMTELAELEELEALAEIPLSDKVVWSDGDIVFPGYDISTKAKSIMREELLADGLVDHGREYIVLIGKKQMHINGDKQSRSVFKKYRRLAESLQQPWMDDEEQEYRFFIVP